MAYVNNAGDPEIKAMLVHGTSTADIMLQTQSYHTMPPNILHEAQLEDI